MAGPLSPSSHMHFWTFARELFASTNFYIPKFMSGLDLFSRVCRLCLFNGIFKLEIFYNPPTTTGLKIQLNLN